MSWSSGYSTHANNVEPPDQVTSVPLALQHFQSWQVQMKYQVSAHRERTPQNILIHKLLWLKRLQQPGVTQQETDGHMIVSNLWLIREKEMS